MIHNWGLVLIFSVIFWVNKKINPFFLLQTQMEVLIPILIQSDRVCLLSGKERSLKNKQSSLLECRTLTDSGGKVYFVSFGYQTKV